MNLKATLVLALVMLLYVTIGGVIFFVIESHHENTLRSNMTSGFVNFLARNPCVDSTDFANTLQAFFHAIKVGNVVIGNYSSPPNWDLYNSVFFSATVITTIGYGNVSPATDGGRSFCVFFALIGIPLMLFLLAGVGDQLHRLIGFSRKNICHAICGRCSEGHQRLIGSIVTTVVGIALFFFIPAAIFTAMEDGWTYSESVYYSFVTLLTVGFGDYVAGASSGTHYQYLGLYRIMIAFWIVVGLAYCSCLVTSFQQTYVEFLKKTESAVEAAEERFEEQILHHQPHSKKKPTKEEQDKIKHPNIVDIPHVDEKEGVHKSVD